MQIRNGPEPEKEVRIRALQDDINEVMAQPSTRCIFGAMMRGANIFSDLNGRHPELLSFLVKHQKDENP